jgi:hypothetical protein
MARDAGAAPKLLVVTLFAALLTACAAADVQAPAADQPSTGPSAPPGPTVTPGAAASPPTVRVDVLSGTSATEGGPGAYRYRVEVPQLDGLPARSQPVDTLIRSRMQKVVDDFLGLARDNQSGPPISELTCASRTVRATSRLAVLRVDCSSYQAGSAHPSTETPTFNCDLAAGRILTLQDLFRGGAAYLAVLSAAARTQLRASLPEADEQVLNAGTAPAVANFRAFLLNRGGLVVVFARYQVAPGAAGQPEISVSYDDLQRYVAPGITDLLTAE